MKKYLLFLFVVVAITSRAQVYSCNQMQPFCTSNVYTYQAGYDPSNPGSGNGPQASTISPGNNYGCLTTQPNPVWYYLEIDQPGNLNITLSNINSSGVGVDIDFICYGPFNNLAGAQLRCGAYTGSTSICIPFFSTCPGGATCNGTCYGGGTVDCSYDPQATEVVHISGATTGQVYVICITNFSNAATTITAQKTSGNATTNCSILLPGCSADAGLVQGNKTIDFCADDNPITLSTLSYVRDSTSPRDILRWGVWLLSDPNNVVNPQNPGPIPNDKYPQDDANYIGLLAAKGPSISYTPTGDGATYYIAPLWVDSVSNTLDSCTGLHPPQGYTIYNNPPLAFTQTIIGCDVSITLTGGYPSVNAAGVYSWSYINPQGNTITGTGNTITFTAPTSGNYVFSITNDGKNCDLLNFLSVNLNCLCPDFAGTQSHTLTSGSQSNDVLFLCYGDSLQITHNQNAILTGDGNNATAPGIEYAVYTCPPSVTGSAFADVMGDACRLPISPGLLTIHVPQAQSNGNTSIKNLGSYQDILGNKNSTLDDAPVRVWFAPVTMDNKANGTAVENIGAIDECMNVNISNAFSVVFLNPILQSGVNNTLYGSPCDGSFVLNGGLPQWDNSDYTVNIALQGNPSVVGIVTTSANSVGDSVKFNVPQQGVYVVTVSDGKSCDLVFTITMNCNICNAIAGTITTSPNNFVCFGNTFYVKSNNDFSGIFEEETTNDLVNLGGDGDKFNGVGYGAFQNPPLNVSPVGNPDFLGLISVDPQTAGGQAQGGGVVNTNGGNTVIYIAPIYMFDASNDASTNNLIAALDMDNDGVADCFNVNTAATVKVTFLDSITLNTPTIVCNTSNGTFDISVSASGGRPAADGSLFTFQIGNNILKAANNTTTTFTNITANGGVTITVSDSAGCDKSYTYPLPQVGGAVSATSNYNGYNISCFGATDGNAIATGSGGSGNYSYIWSNGSNTQTISGLSGDVPYRVTITDLNDPSICPYDETVTLTQPDRLVINTPLISQISCSSARDGAITISATGGSQLYTYSFNGGLYQTDTFFNNLTPGNYTFDVKDKNQCSSTLQLSLSDPAPATLYITPSDTTIYKGKVVQLNSNFGPYANSAIVSYSWTPSTDLSCNNCPNPVFQGGRDTNQYVLTVVYNNNCIVSTSTVVYIVEDRFAFAVPTAFSPNNDGKNDLFRIILNEDVTGYQMRIYNRWGEKVFETNDAKTGWDGKYKGTPQPSEIYVCYFTLTKANGEVLHKEVSFSLLK